MFTLYIFLTCVVVCVFSVVLVVYTQLVTQCSLSPSLCLSLYPAEAMAAVLVKRSVYPIRMMKRPFITTLPLASR